MTLKDIGHWFVGAWDWLINVDLITVAIYALGLFIILAGITIIKRVVLYWADKVKLLLR